MDERQRHFFNAKIVIGIAIIVIGVLALLHNLGVDLKVNIWDYWPLILLFIGFGLLLRPRENRQYFSGIILLVLGGFFLAYNLIEEFAFDIGDLLLVIVVIIGAKILTLGLWESKKTPISKDHINLSAILGGAKFHLNSKELKGGQATAIMGECNVNLRDADFEGESIVIDAFAVMGAVVLMVPNTWEVVIQGAPIMGAMEDKTNHYSGIEKAQKKRLIINGSAIMGSVEVIN